MKIDLGLDIPIVIPAGKEVKVIITYSIPMGSLPDDNPPNTYMGATLIKDNTEMPQGSRKMALPYNASDRNQSISNMGTITNTFIEKFSDLEQDLRVSYSVRGYIEQYEQDQTTPSYTYKFNMWQTGTPNYNWGKASVSYQVYIK